MAVFLGALVLAGLTGWIIEAVASGTIDRAVSAFRELVGGWRPDPWPRGVQEEDRDRPWGRVAQVSPPPDMQPVSTTRVAAHIRSR